MEASIRVANWAPPISIENTPTGKPESTATFSAMFSAKAVFPMEGRPATMIRSPGWKPEVFWSRSMKPVGTPVISEGLSLSCNSWIRSTTWVNKG
jgi:hypothetical protein